MLLLHKFASLTALLALLTLGGANVPAPVSAARSLPQVTLWAWERPEDLRFLTSDNVGVAFLAGAVYLDQQPVVHPRLQPLRVGGHTPITAVVRLEITKSTPAVFPDEYRHRLAEQIVRLSAIAQVSALQIDFDATRSQQGFYRSLLGDVRERLPASLPLSITALGSWCMGDDWLRGLPIAEAVPMLFRMGPDRASIVQSPSWGEDFREPLCRGSVGVSTDEPWPAPLLGRHVYVFNPRAWNPESFAAVQRKLEP
jgi:Protein of unknown function (DUF3142)